MEHVIASKIMNHMNITQQLYVHEHVFRSNLSCETQLVEFSTDILKSLHKQCDAIFMDFSKAFDKVSHSSLLYKLKRAGINDQTVGWIKPLLSLQSQSVVVDGENSDFVSVTSGVPQGSVLGPILFLIFINDLPNYTRHSNVRLFADDTVIYLTITCTQDANKLQYDLNRLESWAREWLMDFNLDKTYVLRFSRKKTKQLATSSKIVYWKR